MRQCTNVNIHQLYSFSLLRTIYCCCLWIHLLKAHFGWAQMALPPTTSLLLWCMKILKGEEHHSIALAAALPNCGARKGHVNWDYRSVCCSTLWTRNDCPRALQWEILKNPTVLLLLFLKWVCCLSNITHFPLRAGQCKRSFCLQICQSGPGNLWVTSSCL